MQQESPLESETICGGTYRLGYRGMMKIMPSTLIDLNKSQAYQWKKLVSNYKKGFNGVVVCWQGLIWAGSWQNRTYFEKGLLGSGNSAPICKKISTVSSQWSVAADNTWNQGENASLLFEITLTVVNTMPISSAEWELGFYYLNLIFTRKPSLSTHYHHLVPAMYQYCQTSFDKV